MPRLLRLWFTFEHSVPRRTYAMHGAALVALKYAVDTLLYWAGTGHAWAPTYYVPSLTASVTTHGFAGAPAWLLPAMGVWTVPFIWIGVTMTLRRALDAGLSAWLSLLFFVPVVNWLLIAMLAALPSRQSGSRAAVEPRSYENRLPSAMLAIAAGAATGIAGFVTALLGKGDYSAPLFFGTPFFIGAITAFLFNRRYPATRRETTEVVLFTTCLVAVLFLVGAAEGAICIVMAAPLALLAAYMGSAVGRAIALDRSGRQAHAMMAMLALPASILATDAPRQSTVREVISSVEIDATPDVVWRNVIAFPEIPEPSALIFRTGIAYPRHARIVGTGVGAVRYCVFSTGAFVEPITRWEPGRRLAFDVASAPPPMRELSPYANISPPHLDGWLRSRRGEFRLIALPGGRTRLEGSTWYEQHLAPQAYWVLYSDWLIHRIHVRVLDHIKTESERAARH